MNSDTAIKMKLDLNYCKNAIKNLTLINVAFVLPALLTRHNKRMMTNCFLDGNFVFQLVYVVIKNYLKLL
jgi:hypothetical protein